MGQFSDRQGVAAWMNVHKGQLVRLTCPGTTLRLVGRSDGIEQVDACSTDVFLGELRTDLPGVQIALTLHDEVLAVHLLAKGDAPGAGQVSLPLSLPYDRLRLERADAPEAGAARGPGRPGAKEEPDFSPYELLQFTRSD